ncbi:hypothetical protein IHE44_0010169 [Lamprotornis superbus]|uniref:Myosin motor domain-containing protein n=1 Tax=Lamprotornis superbus TaxID=245042 RepID=A0A835NGC8_9PASS|nr:hypothetical protein IHE44_0010169 [Lamprotornis superbus]
MLFEPIYFVFLDTDKTLEFDRDFRIKHYAGDVIYSVTGFIDKNKDTLFQDFKRLMYNRAQNLVPKSVTLARVMPCELEAAVGLGRNQLLDCAERLQLKRFSHSSNPVLKMMWPEGKLSITEVTKRPLTAATLFKNSMIALVDNLTLKAQSLPFVLDLKS